MAFFSTTTNNQTSHPNTTLLIHDPRTRQAFTAPRTSDSIITHARLNKMSARTFLIHLLPLMLPLRTLGITSANNTANNNIMNATADLISSNSKAPVACRPKDADCGKNNDCCGELCCCMTSLDEQGDPFSGQYEGWCCPEFACE